MTTPNFDAQRKFAAGLPGASEDIKWGADLVYSVGAKMFCVFLLEGNRVGGHTKSCSFKVDNDRFLELTGVPGVVPAPYLARAMWVQERGLGEALMRAAEAPALEAGRTPSDSLKQELRAHVAKEIGAFARPDDIRFTDALPKTRSGKIMRRLLREIASGDEVRGDVTTLEDLSILARLREEE